MGSGGAVLALGIVAADDLPRVLVPPGAQLLVGDGTGSAIVMAAMRDRGLEPTRVDERDTSLEARRLYFIDNPPPLFARWVPVGMRSPGRPIDDYAAVAIALRWRARQQAG